MTDPFSTGALREQVLAIWTGSPGSADRFREDANAEEDLALGGYRDRLVVELAQNAADAAARAGVPGRLLLRLAQVGDGHLLVAANTGAPLDATGVRALASLRASAKRDGDASVGRFGVGFAAVLAVTDEPAVVSHGAGVRFSRDDTRALVRDVAASHAGLAEEVERREGHVPVLRLPFATDGVAPAGFDTAVLLPLRDGAALDLTRRLLDEIDDALLLALPGLAKVLVELPDEPARRLADVAQRWHALRRSGVHPSETLADRPTEERRRPGWSLTWALPRAGAAVPRVLHAPTPTDEPLDWPALLVASFPLDPTRRHVAQGPAADALVAAAAGAYSDLLVERARAGDDVLPLVPVGLPAGRLDAELRTATLAQLPDVPLLRAVEDGALLRPREAVLLEGEAGDAGTALDVLAPVLAGLVAAPRPAAAALRALGVRRMSLSDVVELLPADLSPPEWGRRYAGLEPLAGDAADRESLAALPVPLADGRVVRGVRGSVVPADVPPGALAALARHGLRVVHPDALAEPAAVRLLERLGARPAGARSLLDDPAARALVEEADDAAADDTDAADAVLSLVSAAVGAAELAPGDLPWLADLPLPAADGEVVPAGALVVPGSPAADLLDTDEVEPVAREVVDRWGTEVLEAVGVARTLARLRAVDVDLEDLPEALTSPDGAREWAASLGRGSVAEVVVLRDLDLVRDDAWPAALAVVASDPALRAALVTPVRLGGGEGGRRGPSYTAWWLRTRLGLSDRADPAAAPDLVALLPPAPSWVAGLDAGLRDVLGLVRTWEDLDGAGWGSVLAGMVGDPPPLRVMAAAWTALAAAVDLEVDPPLRVVALGPGGALAVTGPDDAVVVDAPMWLQRHDIGGLVLAPGGLADALADHLDLDLASERADGVVDAPGEPSEVPEAVRTLLPGCPATWQEHEVLHVDGVQVDWWVSADGAVHAVTLAGLARGLAQSAGSWSRRLAVEAALTDPGSAAAVLAEEVLG